VENDFQIFIQGLKEAFNSALAELTNSLAEMKVLPELSEPQGNGVAYDKFLDIYNQMSGLEISGDIPADNEPIDTVV